MHKFDGLNHDFQFIYDLSETSIKSPGKATFGGVWTMEEGQSVDFFTDLYKVIFSQFDSLLEKTIVLPPEYFFPSVFKNQSKALEAIGFEQKYSDFNFHIELTGWSHSFMSKGNKKKIRQFFEAGGIVEECKVTDYLNAYLVLKSNRQVRGVEMSMDSIKFVKNLTVLPEKYKAYVARIGVEIAAVAYVVGLTKDVRYVLFWGDDINFRKLSPVASLLDFLVTESRDLGYQILDLGISSVNGIRDEGLSRFKRNLGAKESLKTTYQEISITR